MCYNTSIIPFLFIAVAQTIEEAKKTKVISSDHLLLMIAMTVIKRFKRSKN